MALGKRGFKRSSSSTTSTVTTIVILGICVLGVWMLTGDSFEVPKATTSTTNTRTISNSAISLSNEPETIKTIKKNDQTTFRDNPGVLPSDAIQTDEPKHTQNTNDKAKKKDSTSAPTGGSDKQEKERASSVGESKISDEEKVNKIVEDSSQGLQGKESAEEQMKQREGETQISEESTLTNNQHAEQQQPKQDLESNTKANEDMIKQQLLEDAGNQTTFLETQNRIPNEDKLQRIKQHQEKQVQQKQEPPRSSFSDETIPQGQAPSPSELQAENVENTMKHENQDTKPENNGERTKVKRIKEHKTTNSNSGETFPGGSTTGIPKESTESKKSWSTQATQSENEKERRKDESEGNEIRNGTWHLCNETSGPDFIPCLDNVKAVKKLRSTKHYEHRERHCPQMGPTCLVPLPAGYKIPIAWPTSRDKIWYRNVPHAMLAQVKGHQNWVKVMGEFLTFPGGGTQFIHGALHYIDFIQKSVPNIAWGKRTRVVLDVGCGVASFGGYLFDRDVITMSFAPKDEHEAQVQFALERGIPAISAVMGSRRLPFPSNVFDLLHCARCRVPWHAEGGKLLMELNRVLRPGGYFVWSATPVYRKLEEDAAIWKAMSNLTVSMCWELVTIKMDKLNSAGLAIYRKPTTNECYEKRNRKTPPMCKNEDDPNAAWYVPLQACLHLLHVSKAERGSQWPEEWPLRLQKAPYWLNSSQMGIYGKPAPQDFTKDYEHWKNVVSSSYMSGLGISWSNVRNVMDMRAVYGGFAAALKDLQVWVMNVVNINSPDTLPIIYERGLFGIYHDWCESFSSYPRSYDLLHADHLFSQLKKRCKLIPVMAEVDRLVRPGGKLIIRDESSTVGELENLLKSLHWEVHFTFSKDQEGILSAQKGQWRPDTYQASS